MKCEKCGVNTATTHIETVVNGVLTEKNLCSLCAAQEGFDINPQNGLAGIFASMFGEPTEHTVRAAKQCPVCKSTFNDIAESGKAGCSECYNTFKQELLPYIKRVHGSIKHVGRIPDSVPLNIVTQKDEISELRNELQKLVSEEKYEQAAVIRDKIRQMEA